MKSKLLLYLSGAGGLLVAGWFLISVSGWKTLTEDLANPYTTTERATYEVTFPTPLKLGLQGLGVACLAGAGFCGIKSLKIVHPLITEAAGLPPELPLTEGVLPPLFTTSLQQPRPLSPQPRYQDTARNVVPPSQSLRSVPQQIQQNNIPQSHPELDIPDDCVGIHNCQDPDKKAKLLQLWRLLDQPDNRFILNLLLSSPLLIWGEMGAGKTSFCSYLVLLRKLFCDYDAEIVDPHADLQDGAWPSLFPIYGWNFNYAEVDERLRAFYKRCEKPQKPFVPVFDEVSNYASAGACTPSAINPFLKKVLTDSRKAREFPILLAHSPTLGNLGQASGGVAKMKDLGFVTIHLIAERNRIGKTKFLGKGTIKGLDKDQFGNPIEKPIQLQEWMQPRFLIDLFPELAEIHPHNRPYLVSNEEIEWTEIGETESKYEEEFATIVSKVETGEIKLPVPEEEE